MKKGDLAVLIFAFFMFSIPVFSQESLEQKLFDQGFEQIIIYDSGDTLQVFFEHRLFRNPRQSMEFASKIIGELEGKVLVFVPVYHNVPVAKYNSSNFAYSKLSSNDLGLWNNQGNRIGNYRFHARVSPDFSARFGKFDDPFQNKTNLILDTRIYLFSGLSLHTGILFPLNNNLDAQEMNIRLSPSHLHLFKTFSNYHFLSIKGGLFFFDRYGLDIQYRYMPFSSPLSVGLESSVTGFYFFPKEGLYISGIDDLSLLIDIEYRLNFIPNVSVGLTFGQFLFRDRGMRFDLLRQYGNVDFGFFAAITGSGRNYGFQFAFPLFPGKLFRTNNVEIRTTEEFRWEYSYNNEDVVARRFRLGTPRLKDVIRQYHPSFINY